jgi:hypothetical protein
MVAVKKRFGREEEFLQEKIVVSAIKSGAPPGYARTIAQEIGRTVAEGVSTQDIRKKVLARLAAENPDWQRNWMMYDNAAGKPVD